MIFFLASPPGSFRGEFLYSFVACFYTEWIVDDQVVGQMLYDHKFDYDENINVVNDPEFKEIVVMVKKYLNQKRKEIAENSRKLKSEN
ncbi:hypothetical protein ACT29H_16215 [Thermophagus sp. OGC60D27]|uniref:hypothetical protein n=1 Tax=Thermophagus sp. OGC60D27 TaxID=3458415 RepID=UPI0040384584